MKTILGSDNTADDILEAMEFDEPSREQIVLAINTRDELRRQVVILSELLASMQRPTFDPHPATIREMERSANAALAMADGEVKL